MKRPILPIGALFFCVVFSVVNLSAQENIQIRLDSLIKALETETDPKIKTKALNAIGFGYLSVDGNKALEYANKALEMADNTGNIEEKARAYNTLACYNINAGEMKEAIANFEQSQYFYEQTDVQRGKGDVIGNLGIVYYCLGDYDKALDYGLRSLRVFENIQYQVGMASQNLNIGIVYLEQGLYDKAEQYVAVGLRLFRVLKDYDGEANALGNLANIYIKQSREPEAINAYNESIKIYEAIGQSSGIARNLSNLSTLYHDQRNYINAHNCLKRALSLFEKAKDNAGVCYTSINLGTGYYLSYKNYYRRDSIFHLIPGTRSELLQKGITWLEKSAVVAKQIESIDAQRGIGRILSEAYTDAGDIGKAFEAYKMHISAKDSLTSIEAKREVEKLTTEREVELKDKQIELDRLAVEKKRNERLYFGIGIALLLLSMSFVYRNYANQKQSNVKLAALNHQIEDKNLQLEDKNGQLSQTLLDLRDTQEQLVESEKQKEKALVRSRISQDIHDDISSGLTKISWLAETYLAKAAQTGIDVKPLEKINNQARDTVFKLSEIIWSSNPERDNLDGMLQFMQKYVANYMEDAPMRLRLDFPSEVPHVLVSPDVRRNLYLVMKEALHNARKYSQANEIRVAFALDGQQYRLEVQDDGLGMEPGLVQGGGNGMVNMQRRMEAICGQMQVDSAAGKGVKMTFAGAL